MFECVLGKKKIACLIHLWMLESLEIVFVQFWKKQGRTYVTPNVWVAEHTLHRTYGLPDIRYTERLGCRTYVSPNVQVAEHTLHRTYGLPNVRYTERMGCRTYVTPNVWVAEHMYHRTYELPNIRITERMRSRVLRLLCT